MNRNIYKHLYAVLPLALVILLTGCINEGEGLCPDLDEGTDSYMMFRVVAPRAIMTKAASRIVPDVDNTDYWSDTYTSEKGVDFDNALLKNGFNVFITKPDGTPITKLRNLLCAETAVNGNEVVFNFSGEIPQNEVETLKTYTDAGIHITANCGSDISLADNLSFSHAGQPSESFTAIPMWGVTNFDFTTLQPGYNDAGDIWLLRAMAKVEIVIAADGENTNLVTALNSASVSNTNTQGYVLPLAWNRVANTKILSYENTLHALLVAGNINNLTVKENKIIFYLPETVNTGGNTEITLNYTTANGESKSNRIKFARYENGTPSGTNYDIIRNHLYRFEVFLAGMSDKLEIKYTVCPWQVYEVNPPVFD